MTKPKKPARRRKPYRKPHCNALTPPPDVDPRLAIIDRAIEAVSHGDTLRAFCRRQREGNPDKGIEPNPDFPSESTIRLWVVNDDPVGISARYAKAREAQAEAWSEEILDIADESRNDYMLTDKGLMPDHEHINRSRLRVDARKWLMAKLHPKAYGEKVDVTSGGEKLEKQVLVIGDRTVEF